MTTFFGKTNNATSAVADVAGINGTSDPVTFNVTTGEGTLFPASNFKITIDNEIMLCTSRTGDALTCTRASEGTTIAAHTQNATVEHRITAASLTEYETLSKMQGMDYAADAGSTDAYAVTLAPAPTAYFTGMVVKFKANTLNTGAATLNVNSLGAKDIKKNYNTALATGDIVANQIVTVVYDGTNFQTQSPSAALISTILADGWTDISAYTLVYASASTFTVAGVDVTALFKAGAKLKFTNTTLKYAYVQSSTFSTDTTVTINGGTDYTLANAAITAPFISYEENPQVFPHSFNYTPTFTNFTIGNGTIARYTFKMINKIVRISMRVTLGSTSSVGGAIRVSFPVPCSTTYASTVETLGGVCWILDSGTAVFNARPVYQSTTEWLLEPWLASGTYNQATSTSSTVPMTWTTNDAFGGDFDYVAA